MMQTSKWLILPLAVGALVLASGCSKLKSRDEMNKGVQAYKATHYKQAVEHFQEAVAQDPTNQSAQAYLATAYMTQWIPGADSPENNRTVQAARDEFGKILERDPNNKTALSAMAFISYNSAISGTPEQKAKFLDEARKWNQRRIEADPKETEAYYYLGVIAYTQAYGPIQTVRSQLGIKPTDPGPIKDSKKGHEREDLKEKYGKLIDDGIASLQKALDLDSDNDDAMSYINLLLRKKADLEDTAEAAKADTDKANDWVEKALAKKKEKASRPQKKES